MSGFFMLFLIQKKKKKYTVKFGEIIEKKVDGIKKFFKNRLNVKKWSKKEAVEKKLKAIIGKRLFADVIKILLSFHIH
ncbi:MAG: hypothetical protein ACP6IY_18310 [Promethearchaeia archaeon]